MTEYINRETFVADKRKQYCEDCHRRKGMKNGKMRFCYEIGGVPCRACGIDDMFNDIEDYPAADVVEVRHGKWQNGDMPTYGGYKCSLCGENTTHYKANFCPNCGARMDKEDGT